MDGAGAGPARRVIGGTIRRLRTEGGLTIEQLADRAGVSCQHLSEIETGKQNFSIALLERLCQALDATLGTVVTTAYDKQG